MTSQVKQRVVRASNMNFTVLETGEGQLVRACTASPTLRTPFAIRCPRWLRRDTTASHRSCAATPQPSPHRTVGYDSPALSEDALSLITALGYKDAILFGHDWGAVAAYGAAAASPDCVTKLVTAAVEELFKQNKR